MRGLPLGVVLTGRSRVAAVARVILCIAIAAGGVDAGDEDSQDEYRERVLRRDRDGLRVPISVISKFHVRLAESLGAEFGDSTFCQSNSAFPYVLGHVDRKYTQAARLTDPYHKSSAGKEATWVVGHGQLGVFHIELSSKRTDRSLGSITIDGYVLWVEIELFGPGVSLAERHAFFREKSIQELIKDVLDRESSSLRDQLEANVSDNLALRLPVGVVSRFHHRLATSLWKTDATYSSCRYEGALSRHFGNPAPDTGRGVMLERPYGKRLRSDLKWTVYHWESPEYRIVLSSNKTADTLGSVDIDIHRVFVNVVPLGDNKSVDQPHDWLKNQSIRQFMEPLFSSPQEPPIESLFPKPDSKEAEAPKPASADQ